MEVQVGTAAVVVKEDSFLVIKRATKDEFAKEASWTLPGGRVENYEDPNQAVLREIKEETGIEVEIVKPIGIWSGRKNNVWRIIIHYLCKYRKGRVKLSKEHSEFSWIKFKELKKAELEEWVKEKAKIAVKELNRK
ncbi:MAG: NUDIX domain-containing protein [Candidatus Aenigmatarchaeota archaeon]